MVGIIRLAARACLAAIFLSSGVRALRDPTWQVTKAKEEIPMLPEPHLVARTQAAVQVAGGAALVTGFATPVAAAALAATLIPVTYVGHPFWKIEDPRERRQQITQFLKNLGLFGGLLLLVLPPARSDRE